MNIGQLLRGLIGQQQTMEFDGKVLELQVGQIVKGMVLKMLSDQEALVNIGGALVKAKLEVPLQQGQVTMLQVQPESNGGQTVLKPVGASNVPLANVSFPELLKDFKLQDNAMNRLLLQYMHTSGVPINKANVMALGQAVHSMPAVAQPTEWIESAVIALQRSLPINAETVGAIHQTVFGAPFHQLLSRLESALGQFQMRSAADSTARANPEISTPRGEFISKVEQLVQLLRDNVFRPIASTSNLASVQHNPVQTNTPQTPVNLQSAPTLTSSENNSSSQVLTNDSKTAQQMLNTTANEGTSTRQQPNVMSNNGQAGSLPTNVPNNNSNSVAQPSNASAIGNQMLSQQQPNQVQRVPTEAIQPQGSNQEPNVNMNKQASEHPKSLPLNSSQTEIPKSTDHMAIRQPNGLLDLLKSIGLDLEKQIAQKVVSTSDETGDQVRKAATETLKGLLLQIATSNEAPTALREVASQMLQHITGQQLLLNVHADRSAQFAHITLFVPIENGDHRQTASIHIQSRKGDKGELDPENCRLLFDLSMETIGHTIVDVQVVKRIVSLQLHNDVPEINQLVAEGKSEIEDSLREMRYQLLTMKTLPYPTPTETNQSEDSKASPFTNNLNKRKTYTSQPYKGVDLRI